MGARKHFTPARIQELIQFYMAGHSIPECADKFGIRWNAVYYHLKENNIKTRSISEGTAMGKTLPDGVFIPFPTIKGNGFLTMKSVVYDKQKKFAGISEVSRNTGIKTATLYSAMNTIKKLDYTIIDGKKKLILNVKFWNWANRKMSSAKKKSFFKNRTSKKHYERAHLTNFANSR